MFNFLLILIIVRVRISEKNSSEWTPPKKNSSEPDDFHRNSDEFNFVNFWVNESDKIFFVPMSLGIWGYFCIGFGGSQGSEGGRHFAKIGERKLRFWKFLKRNLERQKSSKFRKFRNFPHVKKNSDPAVPLTSLP